MEGRFQNYKNSSCEVSWTSSCLNFAEFEVHHFVEEKGSSCGTGKPKAMKNVIYLKHGVRY
jgi:hypothetical protein